MMKLHLTVFLIVTLSSFVFGFSRNIKLGGLFEKDDPCQRAFALSANAVNKLRRKSDDLANLKISPVTKFIINDAFEISQRACSLLGAGVVAIFGPSEGVSSEHVQSMCESVDVPNVVARWESEATRMGAFNFHPNVESLTMVLRHLIDEFRWKSFTILYDSSDGLLRTNKLLEKWDPKGYTVTIRHLGNGPDYREVLDIVKKSKETNIVIDCSYDILEDVLKQAQQVDILSDRHQVIVNNLDLHTLDLEQYQYSGVNFTGIRLTDVESPLSNNTYHDYLLDMGLDDLSKLRIQPALIFDGVQFFARALKRARDVQEGKSQKLACDGSESWDYGPSLSNFMGTTEYRGLTGLIKFDGRRFRTDFELDILQLGPKGLLKIGTYNSTIGIEWRVDGNRVPNTDNEDLQNMTLRVLISLNPPYNMLKESTTLKTGNDRYEGFTIDVIHELSKLLHFNYTFIVTAPDYGRIGDNGKWTGMLGMIINGEADLATTDLTITAEREAAVDFTMPFLNLGISILYRKPGKAPPGTFSFLAPFSHEVWAYVIGVYVFVSLMTFIVARMTRTEWENTDACGNPIEPESENPDGFWSAIGAIMQQGSDVVLSGISTRLLATAWAFFCLIIMYTYTASLASFLVVETIVRPIKSAEDLANLNGAIKYGAKREGSTYKFFQASNYSTYVKMYEYMEENSDDVLVDENDDGKIRVLDPNEKYAFLMESSTIQYIQQRECNLTQIGGLLDSKGYGIAMRKKCEPNSSANSDLYLDSKYRNRLNTAVLHLQENGIISQLQTKWWKEKRGGDKCNVVSVKTSASPLSMQHVGGVFVMTIVGVCLSAFWVFCEFFWDLLRSSKKYNLSLREEFMEEMRFIMKCRENVKPGRNRGRTDSQATNTSAESNTPPYEFSTIVTVQEKS